MNVCFSFPVFELASRPRSVSSPFPLWFAVSVQLTTVLAAIGIGFSWLFDQPSGAHCKACFVECEVVALVVFWQVFWCLSIWNWLAGSLQRSAGEGNKTLAQIEPSVFMFMYQSSSSTKRPFESSRAECSTVFHTRCFSNLKSAFHCPSNLLSPIFTCC